MELLFTLLVVQGGIRKPLVNWEPLCYICVYYKWTSVLYQPVQFLLFISFVFFFLFGLILVLLWLFWSLFQHFLSLLFLSQCICILLLELWSSLYSLLYISGVLNDSHSILFIIMLFLVNVCLYIPFSGFYVLWCIP